MIVPIDFKIPEILKTDKFILKPLTVEFLELDYDAVNFSIHHLKGIFGNDWPPSNITKEQDLEDLKWHQGEFEKRSSFAYTVLNLDETECLGCVYIYPSKKKSFEVDVFYWVRQSMIYLDKELGLVVRKWLEEKWPFKKIAYPGRDISWKEFELLE